MTAGLCPLGRRSALSDGCGDDGAQTADDDDVDNDDGGTLSWTESDDVGGVGPQHSDCDDDATGCDCAACPPASLPRRRLRDCDCDCDQWTPNDGGAGATWLRSSSATSTNTPRDPPYTS